MKIKAKLTFGVGLLFLMILLLATVSGWYVAQLKKDTNNILVANYNTLQYSRNMLLALEDIDRQPEAVAIFGDNLSRQRKNVTEIGEQEATDLISRHFQKALSKPGDSKHLSLIRRDITELMRLNMEAIERKSDIADQTARNAIATISVAGTLCFLVAFILLVNLPSHIANPIKELAESIKEIANQNYSKRVHFEGHNEFGELAGSFNAMAEKLEEYAESKLDKIIKGKKRIETLINNMHDPVIGIDEQKKVLFANDIALKVTGLKREAFVGKAIQDIAIINDLIRDIVKDIFQPDNGNGTSGPLRIFADDKESYFEKEIVPINIVPTGEKTAQFIGQVILLRNITPFKELDLAKTNFIGTVSHEFKTPIASIEMGLQLLENEQVGVLNEEQKGLVSGIKDDVDRLLKITGELLNLAQVESGSIQIQKNPSDVSRIVHYAVQANKTAAEKKQIIIQVTIDSTLTTVMADSEKTAWVLNNLLSNAVRHAPENTIIRVDVQPLLDKVRFSVSDKGIGIEPQYLARIFDRYFRVPGTKKGGTGLGLSISKEFIEAQGGVLSVQSEYGSGSIFSFWLHTTG